MFKLEQWCQRGRKTLPWDWGLGEGPKSRIGSAHQPCFFRHLALRGLFDDVGRTISAANPTALAKARPEGAI
jgi:hypothetical protein